MSSIEVRRGLINMFDRYIGKLRGTAARGGWIMTGCSVQIAGRLRSITQMEFIISSGSRSTLVD